jgi:hypothetical protein
MSQPATILLPVERPTILRYIPSVEKDIAAMSEPERWRVYGALKAAIYTDVCREYAGRPGGQAEYDRRIQVLLGELSL